MLDDLLLQPAEVVEAEDAAEQLAGGFGGGGHVVRLGLELGAEKERGTGQGARGTGTAVGASPGSWA